MVEKKKAKSSKKTTKRKKPAKKTSPKKEELKNVPLPPVVEEKEPKLTKESDFLPSSSIPAAPPIFKPKKKKLPKGTKYYGTGRRKEARAKVWLKSGEGKISLNGKTLEEYFCGRKLLECQAQKPLVVTNTQSSYDVFAELLGGGVPGQAVALSMGIARALLKVNPEFRIKLKREGLLRRDPRMKERKKYGHKGARKSFQYTKR